MEAQSGAFDGVVAAYRTFPSVSVTGNWDEELVSALPGTFKAVSHNGAGYDQLSIPALSARRIIACNVPTAVDDATADTAIFLLLGALRNFRAPFTALLQHDWRGAGVGPGLGHDPQGKLLGILGMGGIGKNFAVKARAFGMKIAYHNRRRLSAAEEKELDATYLSFDELLARSDVLSLNLPLSPATRHTIDAAALAKCKKGVCIVNTARGAVIDEAALVEALESGHVGSVGLDVFEEEPKVHPGLVKCERAFLLPHMGTFTVETQDKMEKWAIRSVRGAVEWALGEGKGEGMSVVGEQRELFEELGGRL